MVIVGGVREVYPSTAVVACLRALPARLLITIGFTVSMYLSEAIVAITLEADRNAS